MQNSAGTRTYFLYDGEEQLCKMDSSGNITAVNTFGANGLVSRDNMVTHVVFYYTFDERGNVAQRLDGSGNVLSTDLYDAYGVRTSTYALNNPWGFGAQWGYYTDTDNAIGLVLLTYRYYDPAVGRFLTRDPAGYGGGANLYSYTQNNPINRIDSSGLWSLTFTFGVFGIAGLVGGGADGGLIIGDTGMGLTGDAFAGPGVGEGLDSSFNVGFSPDSPELGAHGDTMTGIAGAAVLGGGVVGSVFHPTHGTGVFGAGRGGFGVGEVLGGIAAKGITGSLVGPWWHAYNGVDHGGGQHCDQDNNPGNGGQNMPINNGY